MKTKLLIAATIGAGALAWAAKDPVIMKVNGVDIPKSEFEYLYHKNSQQQLAPQSRDEYVNMFVNYRLKVADAMADGIDTTALFKQEMEQYRHDLAAPYMADSTLLNKLVYEACQRSQEEVNTSHIMRFKRQNGTEDAAQKALLDSLHNVLANGGDFETLASRFSEDRGSYLRGGNLGFIVEGRFPYNFEKTAFELQPGQVSGVIESPMGYHIVKSLERRPARGTVKVSHILLLDKPEFSDAEHVAVKQRIDSIYDVLQRNPRKFEELAILFSQDPGSARQGGLLPWFGPGQMVKEFEETAFALPKGGISVPVKSDYGWHIISKIDERGVPPLDAMKAAELNRISSPQDERYDIVRKSQNEQLMKKHKGTFNDAALTPMRQRVATQGLDSLFYVDYEASPLRDMELLKIGKKSYSVGDFVASMRHSLQPEPRMAELFLERNITGYQNRKLREVEEDWLLENVPEYSNLYNEYRNGSLLYEASVKNVWDVASKDQEGLKNYFEQHRSDYGWTEPRAKGILVQTKNDSIAAAIMSRYAELDKRDALPTLRKEFKGEASFDKVLVSKGTNPLVDNLLFNGAPVMPLNGNYKTFFMLDGRVILAPEDVSDVKGQVTSDFQEALEQQWLSELHRKYPVEIYQKVLKKVK